MTNKWTIILLLFLCCATTSWGQIPYYGGTVGENSLYGYHSVKFRPGQNNTTTYSTAQYGMTHWLSLGTDLTTAPDVRDIGYSLRVGWKFNPWINAGVQITPSFNLDENHEFAYNTTGLFMNGHITKGGKLFWTSNTWYTVDTNANSSVHQWWYLGSQFSFKNGSSIWPHLGLLHSWEFDQDLDLAAGFFFLYKRYGFYLWGNDFFKEHPRIVVAFDFTL